MSAAEGGGKADKKAAKPETRDEDADAQGASGAKTNTPDEEKNVAQPKDLLGLEGKVILVTGGNRGIGRTIVELLESLGAIVAFTDRSEKKHTHGALSIHADVTYPGEMERTIERVEDELGPLYGIVANAGVTRDGFFHKMTHRDWDGVVAVNLTGVYNTIRPAFPLMRERGEGSIVLISSIIGERGGLGQVNYGATKSALIGMAKSLAAEGAGKGIRVNAVAPGFIDTDMVKAVPQPIRDKLTAEIPLGRFGKPEEIAWPVTMLLSPVAGGFMTGAVISANGGHHM